MRISLQNLPNLAESAELYRICRTLQNLAESVEPYKIYRTLQNLQNRGQFILQNSPISKSVELLITFSLDVQIMKIRSKDQVPETIYMMRQAGISVWMLTGDKQETAINIGFSCNLIDQTQELFSLDTDSLESTKERLNVRFLLYGSNSGLKLSKGVLI